ncbi:hypothetical protein [Blastomonas fulva]|uniref:hypothetical protein n=1 Tax=Blastomonas fulva TaxID=1550728 RepID=UPI0025A436EE|nr:hypothetical protein [Blastomonas fulva]MDM7928346.1 hypothetical protein [Blastomonas fulva]MDM7967178.1 hypothetical protein [Blastomonas fulva]
MPRSPEELSDLLAEQIQFLRASALAYDNGVTAEAKRLATTVSTLVNSGRNAVALLDQIGVKEVISYLSHATPLDSRFPKICLVGIVMNKVGVSFVPYCQFPSVASREHKWISFNHWWADEAIYEVRMGDTEIGTLNRKDLVRYLRSKDGGSHIDEEVTDQTYVQLSRVAETGIIFQRTEGGNLLGFGGAPDGEPVLDGHLAAMRHIAYELEESIKAAGLLSP